MRHDKDTAHVRHESRQAVLAVEDVGDAVDDLQMRAGIGRIGGIDQRTELRVGFVAATAESIGNAVRRHVRVDFNPLADLTVWTGIHTEDRIRKRRVGKGMTLVRKLAVAIGHETSRDAGHAPAVSIRDARVDGPEASA